MTSTDRNRSGGIEWYHRRISLESWDDVYVVGDVHGCLDPLERVLERLEPTDRDLVVFVGDLVRKGPESAAVLELVREAPNMLSVRGNNEQKLLSGDATVPGFGPVEYDQLVSMPVAISWEDTLVVHGGVDPRKRPAAHTAEELQTMRSIDPADGYDGPFWFDEYVGPPRVYFGHTVLERPVDRQWAVGLDTGCVYGGQLTAYDVRNDRFVSVQANEHESRSPERFIRPGPA